MPTTTVTTAFTIYDDEVYSGDPAFNLDGSSAPFINYGAVLSSRIAFDAWNATTIIDNRGVVRVIGTGYAIGVNSPTWGPGILNSGEWTVSGESAFGIQTWSPGVSITNTSTGVWNISAVTYAAGVYSANMAHVINNGAMTVTASNGYAVGVEIMRFDYASDVIVNNGTITVSGNTSVGLSLTGLAVQEQTTPNIINNGTITAQWALVCWNQFSPVQEKIDWLLNTGTLNGMLDLGHGNDIVENRGLINGDIYMHAGNDLVDARLGTINGVVYLEDGNDEFRGGAVGQSVFGGLGDDRMSGGAGDDEFYGENGVDTLNGGGGADYLSGGSAPDTLNGDAGDDVLDGGTGTDILNGGAGFDLASYEFAPSAVTVSLAVQGVSQNTGGYGADTLTSIEDLGGSAFNDQLTGDGNANYLFGLNGNDSLNGGVGADVMIGGLGNDAYVVDNAGDVVSELSAEGTDTVFTSITYTLTSHVEELSALGASAINLFGNGIANLLVGNSAVNGLDGGAGADTLIGGGGDDLYFVDNIADVIIELVGEGASDVVYTSLAFYQLGDNVEQLSVTASTGTFAVGNSVANLIVGNAGADALDGGAGIDTLVGGAGNDSYYVDNVADVIIELTGEGNADVVYTSLAFYQLGDNVEQLSVTAASGTYAVGNGLGNLIVGNAGADALDGGAGVDTLVGGAGNDSYFVDNIADVIIELAGEGNADVVYTSLAFYQLGDNVEQLSVSNASGTYAVGNSVDNLIVGNAGADALEGRGGADVLVGGAGADSFVYNNANEGGDAITDFVSGVDVIRISAAGFGGGLVSGGATPFVAGSTPTSLTASFLYDTDDGRLFWDVDGDGGAAAILIATLSGAPTLTASDIILGP